MNNRVLWVLPCVCLYDPANIFTQIIDEYIYHYIHRLRYLISFCVDGSLMFKLILLVFNFSHRSKEHGFFDRKKGG